METPDSSKRTTQSPVVQDSPFFTYVSSLSPIQPINVSNAADLTLPSPQLVFKTPNDDLPRKLKLLRRSQGLGFSSLEKLSSGEAADASARIDSTGLPSYQLIPCIHKDQKNEASPNDNSPRGQSACVDEFLADPMDDSDASAASPSIHCRKPAELPEAIQNENSTLDESCAADLHSKQFNELPQIAAVENISSNKEVNKNYKENSEDLQNSKPSASADLVDTNMDKITDPAKDFQSVKKVSPSTEGIPLDTNSSKQTGAVVNGQLATCTLNSVEIDGSPLDSQPLEQVSDINQTLFEEQLEPASIIIDKQPKVYLPSGQSSEIEDVEIPVNRITPQNLSFASLDNQVVDSRNENHCDSNMFGTKSEDAKLQFAQCSQWQDRDCIIHPQPESNKDMNEDKYPLNHAEPQETVSSSNQILHSPEDGILQQRGMRKRLQFEAVDNLTIDNDENLATLSSVQPPETPSVVENPTFACAGSSTKSSECIHTKLTSAGDALRRLQHYPYATPESQKVDSSIKARANPATVICRPSGIGLHLNSIGTTSPMNCHANPQVPEKNTITLRKLTPGNKVQLASKSCSGSLKVDTSAKSIAASEHQTAIPSINNEDRFNPEEDQPVSHLDSSNSCQSVLVVKPLEISPPSKPIDCYITRNMKNLPEIGSKLGESMQTSSRKKRKKGSEDDGCKRCSCRKSKCLKLYCDCFAAGSYCGEDCACQDCFNKPEHQDVVLGTRQQIESRDPLAFAPKVVLQVSESQNNNEDGKHVTPSSGRHKRGCNCKKSHCLKKYCECFQAGVGCSLGCRCDGCENTFGRKEGFCNMTELENKILQRESEQNKPAHQERRKNLTVDKLEHSEVRSKFKSKDSHSHLSSITPSVQGSSENQTPKNQFPAKYYPSPDSSASVLASLLESPSSPRILSTFDAGEGSLCFTFFGNEQDYQVKIDTSSPGWDAFPEICNLSPLNPSPSAAGTSSSSTCKVLQTRLFQESGRLSGHTLPRNSPITPIPRFGEGKIVIVPESDSGPRSTIENDTPEFLKDSLPSTSTVKATSPKQKRVSSPQKLLHGGLSRSPSLKNGRRFILQSVPSFPPLSPYSKHTQAHNP